MTVYRITGRDFGEPSLPDAVLAGVAFGDTVDLTLDPAVESVLIDAGLIELVGSAGSVAGVNRWTPLREPGCGGRPDSLIVSPFDSNRVLVGADMFGIGLSLDGGMSWGVTSGLPAYEIGSFTWHPTESLTVWVGTMSGPCKSTDGGKTWTSKRTGMPATQVGKYTAPVEKILIDPANNNHLLAFGGSRRVWLEGPTAVLNYGVVWESQNAGESWAVKSTILANGCVMSAINPNANLTTLLVSIWEVTGSGIYKSTNGGTTWSFSNTGFPASWLSVFAVDPVRGVVVSADTSPDIVGAEWTPGGVFVSTNLGASWSALGTGLPADASSSATATSRYDDVTRAANGDLYTADLNWGGGLKYKLPAGESAWVALPLITNPALPGGERPFVYAADPNNAGTVYAGSSAIIMKTRDGGATWQDISSRQVGGSNQAFQGRGFNGWLAMGIALSPSKRGRMLLAGFDSANILRTEEGDAWTFPAQAWDLYGGGQDVRWATDSIAYAVLGQANKFGGLGVSSDAGVTWAFAAGAGVGLPTWGSIGGWGGYSVCPMSADGTKCLAQLPNGRVYRSADTGVTWVEAFDGSSSRWCEVAPDFSAAYICANLGIYKSVDLGVTWAEMPDFAGSPVVTRLRFAGDGALYACGNYLSGSPSGSRGLWRFEDGAWTLLLEDQTISDIAIDPSNDAHLVYCSTDKPFHDVDTATGCWRSQDRGATWTPLSDGLPMLRVATVVFDPLDPSRLVCGTYGRGFFELTLS